MWRQRYIEFRFEQVSEEIRDAPHLELSSGERTRICPSLLDGPYNVLAHAFLSSSEVSEVHVDNLEKWHIELTGNPNNTIHLLYMLHEIGHALGLHHSPQKHSIMYAFSDQLCDKDEHRRCSEYGRRYGEYGRRSTGKNGARDREDSGFYT
ncbi:hypothetical protein P5V15_007184 [Pogonomyrmex californicus]